MVEKAKTVNEAILQVLISTVGIREWPGEPSNPIVEEFLKAGLRKDHGLTDDVPWCAGYVAWVLAAANRWLPESAPRIVGPTTLRARDYEGWGVKVAYISNAMPGDVVVFCRQGLDSGKGHVAFFVEQVSVNQIRILGGKDRKSVV